MFVCPWGHLHNLWQVEIKNVRALAIKTKNFEMVITEYVKYRMLLSKLLRYTGYGFGSSS
jgi:hypothetical protein